MKKIFFLFAAFFSSMALVPVSSAADHHTSIGALYGVGSHNHSGGTNFSMGASLNHKWTPNFGTGLLVSFSPLSGVPYRQLLRVYDISLMHLDVDLNYHFTHIVKGLWLALRLGYGSYSASDKAVFMDINYTSKGFEWGPAVGYDHHLAENFTVGADVSYIHSAIKTLDKTDISAFQALFVVKHLL